MPEPMIIQSMEWFHRGAGTGDNQGLTGVKITLAPLSDRPKPMYGIIRRLPAEPDAKCISQAHVEILRDAADLIARGGEDA